MKKDLQEIKDIGEKVEKKLSHILYSSEIVNNNINEVKALKNDIYEKTSKVFIYNLRKLIQLEATQKKLDNIYHTATSFTLQENQLK